MYSVSSEGRKEDLPGSAPFRSAVRVSAMILGLGAVTAAAQCLELQKLTASDEAGSQMFGRAVSVSGETAVVGAWGDNCASGYECGAAYVFRFDGTSWAEEQKLTASNATENDQFGKSVSLSGDDVLVGAWSEWRGAAYVFRFNATSWVQQQKLTATGSGAAERFGQSVSLSGDTAVLGAWGNDCADGYECGAAYVYRFDGTSWVEEQKLTASDAAHEDKFGYSVSVNGSAALVGAIKADCAAGFKCGAAYVFRFNGSSWVEEQKLTGSDTATFHHFGESVSLSGNTALVGASLASGGGSAYVFRFNGNSWVEEQKIAAPPRTGGGFASSVSISGDRAVVGAPGAAGGGAAHVFRFDGTSWVEEQKLTPPDRAMDEFGRYVAVSGDTALVGVERDDCAAGFYCGSAHVFSLAEPTGPRPSDLDCDGDVDLFDFASFHVRFSGKLCDFESFQAQLTGPK